MDDLVADRFVEQLSIFKNRRVLVTGDTGFKGSWLSLWLHELGAEVLGYSLPPERSEDHYCSLQLDKIIHHIDGDIRNLDLVQSVFKEFQPEFLFHLAAQSLVRLSYKEPKLTFDTNVGGSVNILEAIRNTPSLRSVIYVTSDKCYKNKEWVWGYRENDELGGHDPYSASKAAAELVFAAYQDSFFCNRQEFGIATVRAGNVIGGGDWSLDRIIPDTIRALQNQQPIRLRNPRSTRPWQHVLEPLGGYLSLAAKLYENPVQFSGAWNFGPRSESVATVQELVSKGIVYWGSGCLELAEEKNAPREANLLQVNCDKAHQLLGWQPRWTFDDTVKQTINWYKEAFDGTPTAELSKQQIELYMGVKS